MEKLDGVNGGVRWMGSCFWLSKLVMWLITNVWCAEWVSVGVSLEECRNLGEPS